MVRKFSFAAVLVNCDNDIYLSIIGTFPDLHIIGHTQVKLTIPSVFRFFYILGRISSSSATFLVFNDQIGREPHRK